MIDVVKKWNILFVLIAIVLGLTFSIKYFGQNYADAPVYKYPLFTSFGWFATLAILGSGAKYLDFTNGFTSLMSRHSWGLYVFHYLGISVIAVELGARHILPAALIYLLSLISAFVFGFGLYELISRIPFLRWAVLGIKRKKE